MLVRKAKSVFQILKAGPQKKEGYFFSMQYADLSPEYAESTQEVSIERITAENVDAILAFRDLVAVDQIKEYINGGATGVIAVSGGKAVGHALCLMPGADYCEFRIRKSAYAFYCHVDEAYRGRGIYPRLLAAIIQIVHADSGIDSFSISTAVDNLASQRGIEKAGFSKKTFYQSWRWWKLYLKRVTV